MPNSPETRTEARRLRDLFAAMGAQVVKADVLQSADTLLDLYGEDIRARAYLTSDPLRGEMVLRPDFTVPVVQMHMESQADPARYTYSGKVFRKQETDESRANEYVQVGFEVFDGRDPARADAEVFASIADALGSLPVQAATGDIGLLKAAVEGLQTTDARKSALVRHIWRPRRFRNLLNRYAGKLPPPATRVALLGNPDPFADAGPEIGLRSRAEVEARIDALRADAAAPHISGEELGLIDAILRLHETTPNVLVELGDIAVDMPSIQAAVDRMSARTDALAARGVDVNGLSFEGSYGRTSLEYYDGFVFGFTAVDRPDMPPIATGGRYDALTAQLGRGRAVPAVGGVIRPDLVLEVAQC
ncbi:ATP phosphoribosyltransferase regulatory subunit [Yoonia sediminilitoris]|uniref:Histidine--tRNA ligase n=1 Tax=Yoonia sediminilitoris TaxID=1286148 RepID=A0A2T6KFW0_9RHOB|nr:ATP phosphoribosyltransferase regulatory subunit [Yoonia sediminilitoris]PUB14212.1 ATP phosphoribosyltransferase regulatory subunit [Yoonia sediminilitoris]RCW95143.1 ATP phosphoribosyltransferase regulatory subunit [Yoonia sediminilitoris]